ncbi:MAG: 4a-hydroxytetrahydrobiopterin dehydratase [Parachlamydiaceae bacterium]|nr:4a-hydroxytetrahydrobiopterin dehydratase [Parachlamydiaceae bacterium]
MDKKCDLSKKHCVPCRGGVPPLKGRELENLLKELGNGWRVMSEHHLEKKYLFSDFKRGLAFTSRIGGIAEQEGHHPDILLTYGHVIVTLWTHKIDGLTESDFILAAKCDEVSEANEP